jgi:hydroxymethylbilane synthase
VHLRLGTRGSRLALAQSNWVADRIREVHPDWSVDLIPIRTTGDRVLDRPLTTLGGKGLFVKEIEEALLRGEIDCAVHSGKDLPATLAPGLVIAAVPPREDPIDVLVTREGVSLERFPRCGTIGTSSPRRAALLRWLRPDIVVTPLRGNVDTRLRKLREGEVDGVVLAAAGLRRLGIQDVPAQLLDPVLFLPAVAQGALCVETRSDSWKGRLEFLHDVVAGFCVTAERAFLAAVEGSCHTALAARAEVWNGELVLDGLIADPNGQRLVRGRSRGAVQQAEAIGARLAEQLLAAGGREILSSKVPDNPQ